MLLKRFLLAVLLAVGILAEIRDPYEVPEATLIAYKPRGFEISIPDSEGVTLFAFHGNLNKEMQYREAGEMAVDVVRKKNGRWVYENPRLRLKEGDVIYYWLYVIFDRLGYPKDDLKWTVTQLVDKQESTTAQPLPGPTPPPTCQQSVTTVNGVHKCQNELVFEENFNNLQQPKWENVLQFGGEPGFPFVLYTNKAENCYAGDGFLHVKPTLQMEEAVTSGALYLKGCTGQANTEECNRQAAGGYYLPPVLTAQLRTKESFSFRYGKVEVRAKLPLGDWIFSEILLLPKQTTIYKSNSKLSSGQINLALLRGNRDLQNNGLQIGATCIHSNCEMGWNDMYYKEEFNQTRPSFWGGAFHTYAATWTPEFISFIVDGNEIGKIAPPSDGFHSMGPFSSLQDNPWASGSKLAPFDQEFYIALGLGAGGFSAFPDNAISGRSSKPWKNGEAKAIAKFWNSKSEWYPTWNDADSTLQVDYVRVWAL